MGPLFVKLLLFILEIKKFNQNDVKFCLSTGYALVLFASF